MPDFEFFQFPCLSDNYGVLVHDPETGNTASIDAPDTAAVEDALKAKGWILTHILVTHHHADHTQGIASLKAEYDCEVIGPARESDKIRRLDKTVDDGDIFDFCGETIQVISTPGHTLGMVNFHFPQSGVVFTGDTLFALGCGRVFEGDMDMMWRSMERLAQLPPETTIYCGHEYTLANANFAVTVDPENPALLARVEDIKALREKGEPTLPTQLGVELATNPFLRASDPAIRVHLGMENATDAEVFAEIRKRKDNA